jgi:hypothetical protein
VLGQEPHQRTASRDQQAGSVLWFQSCHGPCNVAREQRCDPTR